MSRKARSGWLRCRRVAQAGLDGGYRSECLTTQVFQRPCAEIERDNELILERSALPNPKARCCAHPNSSFSPLWPWLFDYLVTRWYAGSSGRGEPAQLPATAKQLFAGRRENDCKARFSMTGRGPPIELVDMFVHHHCSHREQATRLPVSLTRSCRETGSAVNDLPAEPLFSIARLVDLPCRRGRDADAPGRSAASRARHRVLADRCRSRRGCPPPRHGRRLGSPSARAWPDQPRRHGWCDGSSVRPRPGPAAPSPLPAGRRWRRCAPGR